MPGTKRNQRPTPVRAAKTLPLDFILVVGSERGLEGFRSSDDCEELMREFFKVLEFEYFEPFVCASAQESVVPTPIVTRNITKSQAADVYGQPFELKPELLDHGLMACAGDFKNVMSSAFIDHVRNGTPLNEYKKYFRQLSELPIAEKREAIMDAHKLLIESGNKFGTYVEVRLLGPAKATWSDTVEEEFIGWVDDTEQE